MKLYNSTIAYIYNNNLTSVKHHAVGESPWVQPIHILNHSIIVYLFSYWYGWGGLWHLVLLTHNGLMLDHDIMCASNAS